MRLRESAVCGWRHRGRILTDCLKLMANGYFIEMVGILGSFFEFSSVKMVQGMGGRLELIRTVMKHNDRLALLLHSVCAPYMLKAEPKPQLSLFLDVDLLLAWYSNVLQSSMTETVEHCVDVWKDVTKNTSRLTDMYKHPLPWVCSLSIPPCSCYFLSIPLPASLSRYSPHSNHLISPLCFLFV